MRARSMRWRSWRTLARWPHRQAAAGEEVLGLGDGVLAVMEDRRREHGVGAGLEPLRQVAELADAARGDDRDGHGVGDRAHQLEVVAGAGAVAVHAGEEDLAGAEVADLLAPGEHVEALGGAAAVAVHLPGAVAA